MDEKKRNQITILFPIALIAVLSVLFFANGTSTEKERQITNAFTPGKTQETTLQTQQSGDEATPADSAGRTSETQPELTPLPPDQPTMIVTNAQGLPIIVTQTRAATQPNQPTSTQKPQATPQNPYPITSQTPNPTNKPAATSTATATTKPSNTPTPTKTLTPTTIVQTGWAGEWKVFWQMENQNYVEGILTVDVVDIDFTASATFGGVNYSFTGRIIYDGETAFGNWTSPTSNGGFIWSAVGAGQFGGSRDNVYGFCGARAGAAPPNPCYIPPLS